MKKLSELKFSALSSVIRAAIIGIITMLLLFVLILAGISPDQYDIHKGQPASKTIYATKDVEDTVTTEEMRAAAANAVEPSYKSVDSSVNAAVLEDVQGSFDRILDLRSSYMGAEVNSALAASINAQAPVTLSQDMISALLGADAETVRGEMEALRDFDFSFLSLYAHHAPRVLLSVHPDNTTARKLYESVGFRYCEGQYWGKEMVMMHHPESAIEGRIS